MFDQLPRSKFSSLPLAWASFSFDKLKSLEKKREGSGLPHRQAGQSHRHFSWASWGRAARQSQVGCQSSWSLAGQQGPVREAPTRQPKQCSWPVLPCSYLSPWCCQLRGAAPPGDSPTLPLHVPGCPHAGSDVHTSTYLYAHFQKHLPRCLPKLPRCSSLFTCPSAPIFPSLCGSHLPR